ncbi:hypothetical protein Daus18300_004197 [Diaporthe australafricana]|uniref:Tyrosinase copper-binding domain-containing protein n=1 Tax=Diaporthe australafricana TaxID=127596 RepID=A0ABR3XAF0_9PEZI
MRGMTPSNGSLAYNPTCLSRDLSNYTASTWLTNANLLNLTTGAASATIKAFQDELQGRFSDGFLGLHVAGHFSIGGDADDLFSSPVDPAFYLHHTMLDYVFWIWQALHPSEALNIAGTLTLGNNPPSRDTRLNDTLYFNYLDQPQRPISDILDTLGGSPLCYIYA